MSIGAEHAQALERCLVTGGVAVFPTDTVYGLACDPEQPAAVERLYALKGRPAAQPAAVLFFALGDALAALPELGPRTRSALSGLLPGAVTVLLPNPAGRFPLACAGADVLGLRVPALGGVLGALATVRRPVLQSSANLSGGPDPRRIADVEESLRSGAGLVLDAGELPGIASTVLDLTGYEAGDGWRIVRAGAVARADVEALLGDG